jgi:Bacterial Ig-like domain
VTLTANATDNVGVTGVQFLIGGANVGTVVAGPGPVFSAAVTLATGSYVVTATATDAAGNSTTSAPINITVH